MKSWIRGEEYVITPTVVVSALSVPLVWQPMYLYIETCPLDDIMSLITGTSISWGTNPCVTSYELSELNYLFFRIFCHFIWPIYHLHFIPIKRCAFLYTLIINAPMRFPTLFICSLVKVHRSSAKSHDLFFPIFIHRILLDLGLEDFPVFEPVYIIALIVVTFLRQKAAQLKASSKYPKVKSSIGDTSSPPPLGDPTTEEYVDPITAVDPTPSSLSDLSLRSMLDTVMTVQAVHGQLLLDVLTKLQALQADLVGARGSTPPTSPFDDDS